MKTHHSDDSSAAQNHAAASRASTHADLVTQVESTKASTPLAHAAHSAWDHSMNRSPRQAAQRRAIERMGIPVLQAPAAGPLPVTQLFRKKGGGPHIEDIPPIEKMSGEDIQNVKDALDKGEIEAETDDELDLFLGVAYGHLYERFPSPLELSKGPWTKFESKEESDEIRISENADSIFKVDVSSGTYFVKEMKSGRGAANEALVPFFAIRLGLAQHATPTVWYEIDGKHYAVTPMLVGKTASSNNDITNLEIVEDRLLELFLFDYLVGSYDRIDANVFITSDGEARLMDNEGSLGLSGYGKPVKNTTGLSRIGYKSAFLGAFMHRLKIYKNIFHPGGLKDLPDELDTALIPKALLARIVNIGSEMIVMMKLLAIPTLSIQFALIHLTTLNDKEKPTVGDVLRGATKK